jgi:hypothetical protein
MKDGTAGSELNSDAKRLCFLSGRANYIAMACFSAKSPMKGNLYICP